MNTQEKQPQTPAYTGDIPNTPLRFLIFISKPHKKWVYLAFFTMAIAQILGIYNFYVVSELIDNFTLADTKEAQLQVLFYWSIIFLAVVVFERLLWRASGFFGIKWVADMQGTAYKKLYAYLMGHSHKYFSERFAGALSNKVSNAVGGSDRLAERLVWGVLPEIISLAATLYLFFLIHWSVALVLTVVVALVFFINLFFVKKRRPYVVDFSKSSSKVRGQGVDVVTNIAATRQYSRHLEEMERIGTAVEDFTYKNKKQWFMGEWLMVLNTVIGIALTVAILVIIYLLLKSDIATAGDLVLVLALLGRIGFLFANMGNMLNGFIRVYGEIEEGLDEVLVDHEIVDSENATQLSVTSGNIDWKDVDFEFGANKVFDNFNLAIKPGQRVGLVGPSGAGKTTFVSLLLRQHDITDGVIAIDGQNIAAVTQDSLREHIAVVPQEPLLFHRTIRENIAYGKPDATQSEIRAVAAKAQALDFILDLPDKFDTLVGERGVKLSGGQKQRVAIARAMLKDAPILVLDEATSALDSESEVAIQKALHTLMEGKTVIAIAHRLSTLREMDRILVLENGQIVEDGTHDELATAKGTYQRLWEHQAGGFLSE